MNKSTMLDRMKAYRDTLINIAEMEETLVRIEARLTQTTKPLAQTPKNRTPKDITNDLLAEKVDMSNAINEKLVSASIEIALIKREILSLPPNAQRVYTLRYLEGKRWDDIATELSYSRAQVFNIHNSTARLKGWTKD